MAQRGQNLDPQSQSCRTDPPTLATSSNSFQNQHLTTIPAKRPSNVNFPPRSSNQEITPHFPSSSLNPTTNHHALNYGDAPHDQKRQRVSDDSAGLIQHSPSMTSNASALEKNMEIPPQIPLIYHLAVSAHHAARNHYQQSFLPSSISIPKEQPPLPRYTTRGREIFSHDRDAGQKALGLLLLSLDLLRLGLGLSGLSDREKVAFGSEYSVVALKVLEAFERMGRLSGIAQHVDTNRIKEDLEQVVAKSLSICQRNSYLRGQLFDLELASARVAFQQDKPNQGKRIIRQALSAATSPDCIAHRYALYLLMMEKTETTSSSDFHSAAVNLEKEAKSHGHHQIVQLVSISRFRACFVQRKWDLIPSSIKSCEEALGRYEPTKGETADRMSQLPQDPLWQSLHLQFILLRALWEGRIGEDTNVRGLLKEAYFLMDDNSEAGMFQGLRSRGGVIEIQLSTSNQRLIVQTTPPNLLWCLTYMTSLVGRRDFLGSVDSCRNLLHANAMRQWENVARAEDMWDTGFHIVHGPSTARQARLAVAMAQIEVMMEQTLALMWRSSFEEAALLLDETISRLRTNGLFYTHAAQIALLHGQLAQLVGMSDRAERYYQAALQLLVPGSELYIIIKMSLAAARGDMENLTLDHKRAEVISKITDGFIFTNINLNAATTFVSSLLDANRVSSKRKLSTSYEMSHKSNNNILRGLIFAFTTGIHLYGGRDKLLKQLEAGRSLAYQLGGKDREDGVGQVILGLWYAVKLRDHHRLDGNFEEQKKMQVSVDAHLERLDEIRAFAQRRFPLENA